MKNLKSFTEAFNVIYLNQDICEISRNLLIQYKLSNGLLLADSLIAATAIYNNCDFISKNQKDYKFIANLKLLKYPPKV